MYLDPVLCAHIKYKEGNMVNIDIDDDNKLLKLRKQTMLMS